MYSHNTFEYKLDYYIFFYIKNISIKTKTIAYAWYIYSLDYKTHTCIYIYIYRNFYFKFARKLTCFTK
jgi:hypothetical protein